MVIKTRFRVAQRVPGKITKVNSIATVASMVQNHALMYQMCVLYIHTVCVCNSVCVQSYTHLIHKGTHLILDCVLHNQGNSSLGTIELEQIITLTEELRQAQLII